MQEKELRKLRRLIRFFIFVVVVFIILSGAALVHSFIDPKSNSFPQVAPAPVQNTIDTKEIAKLIQAEIARQISNPQSSDTRESPPPTNPPTVVNGRNGRDGKNGKDAQPQIAVNGADGISGNNGLSAYDLWLQQGNTGNVDDFLASLKGEKGADGIDGKTPQFRTNPITGQAEIQYVGDRLWSIIPGSCLNIIICGTP